MTSLGCCRIKSSAIAIFLLGTITGSSCARRKCAAELTFWSSRNFLSPAFLQPSTTCTMVQTRRKTHATGTSTFASSSRSPAKTPPRAKRSLKGTVASTVTPKKSPSKSPIKTPLAPSRLVSDGRRLLFALSDDDELVEATLLARPSQRNKSPYVGDIQIQTESFDAAAKGKVINHSVPYPLVHLPNLDMGGKCRSGVRLLVKPSRDRKGVKVSASDVGKYGTPKCEYACQLLYVDESADGKLNENHSDQDSKACEMEKEIHSTGRITAPIRSTTLYPPVWVGAHPSLGERIAELWLQEGLIEGVPAITSLQRQVSKPGGADMRADFMVQHADGSRRIVEIKTVVDTDYAASRPPQNKVKCLFTSSRIPYKRTAIFPWGSSNQKGPDGEKVVSARAIHHVDELAKLSKGLLREEVPSEDDETGWDGTYHATLLFVVIRGDAAAFRPNREACPSFAKHLAKAKAEGVQILAKRVSWGTAEGELGYCYDDIMLPIEWG